MRTLSLILLLTACGGYEKTQEYFYDRGICEMRHGRDCKPRHTKETTVIEKEVVIQKTVHTRLETDQCTVVEYDEGATILCPDGSSAVVSNGVDGTDGQSIKGGPGEQGPQGDPGQDAVLAIIDPCDDGPGVDEVILQLVDGSYLAWYKGKGLVVLEQEVDYETLDTQKCQFKIDSDNNFVEL